MIIITDIMVQPYLLPIVRMSPIRLGFHLQVNQHQFHGEVGEKTQCQKIINFRTPKIDSMDTLHQRYIHTMKKCSKDINEPPRGKTNNVVSKQV